MCAEFFKGYAYYGTGSGYQYGYQPSNAPQQQYYQYDDDQSNQQVTDAPTFFTTAAPLGTDDANIAAATDDFKPLFPVLVRNEIVD